MKSHYSTARAFLSLGIVCCFSYLTQAQGIYNDGANWVIATGATVYIDGDADGSFLNENGGQVDIDGEMIVEGNWTNNAGNRVFINIDSDGWVRLKGTTTQTIDGSSSTRFEYLQFNNSSSGTAISLSINTSVDGICRFTDGVVVTGSNYLIIESTTGLDVVGHSGASFVNGNLRRFIAPNTETYPLPVGDGLTASDYYLAELLNGNLDDVAGDFDYINVKFAPLTNHNDVDLIEVEETTPYVSVSTEGVWFLDPDTDPDLGSYDLKGYTANFSGLTDNEFAILSRPTGSITAADWVCTPCGFGVPGINSNGGAGRMLADGYALRLGMTDFSQKGIGKSSAPLPVELIAFYAECEEEQVTLSWTTASENNNGFFTIEKSIYGAEFTVVEIVSGAGTTNNVSYYHAYDEDVTELTTYYRLKQTDFDGKFTYSDLITANCSKEEEAGFSIIPNPATDYLNIVLNGMYKGDAIFAIYEGSGKMVYRKSFYGELKRFLADIKILAPGIYHARLIAGDRTFTEKFVKF